MQKRTMAALAGSVLALTAIGGTAANAGGLITGHDVKNGSLSGADIKDGTVRFKDLGPGVNAKLHTITKDGVAGPKGDKGDAGKPGTNGADGKDGKDGKDGSGPELYYVTATYGSDVANNPSVGVNEGAIATVKCNDEADHAVAGGVQTLGIDGGVPAAVASSFPGRMDWSTNTPKPNRFDGWIVQFDARNAPVKANIWVTCAKATTITQFEVPVS
jgi:hypothetical protein